MPVVRGLYKGVKQVFETIFLQTGTSFRKVGMVQFRSRACGRSSSSRRRRRPRSPGACRTATSRSSVPALHARDPTTGFFFYLPRREIVEIVDLDRGRR